MHSVKFSSQILEQWQRKPLEGKREIFLLLLFVMTKTNFKL